MRAAAHSASSAPGRGPSSGDDSQRALLDRYVETWEGPDLDGLIALLKSDAILSMPPFRDSAEFRAHSLQVLTLRDAQIEVFDEFQECTLVRCVRLAGGSSVARKN